MDTSIRIPPLIKRNTVYFAIAQAFVGMGTQMTPTLGAIMVARLLGSASLAGIGTSILGVGRFLIAYPVGKINDTYGRKVGMILGLSLSLVASLIIGLSMSLVSFPLFLVGMVIFGLGVGAGGQLRVAAADMYPPARRAEGLGYVLTGSLVGALGGPGLISAAQASSHRFGVEPLALAWMLVPLVILPSILLVFRVRPDPKEIAAHLDRYYPGYQPLAENDAGVNAKVGLFTFFQHYPKLTAFVANFAVQGNMAMMMAMTSLTLSRHGHSLTSISLSVAIHVIGMFGFSLPLGRLTDRVGRRLVSIVGLALAGAGSLLVPATGSYWPITAGLFLVGLGWSCVNVAATTLIADTTGPLERARAIGANDTFSSVSTILFPLLAGPLVEFLGFRFLGFLGAAMMLPPFVLLLKLRERSPGVYR
ncbi:MAG: MFS transporter [Chloroflexota bacterium]